jgi:hypothetical protein
MSETRGIIMNDQALAAVRGWQDTVNAAWEQQAGLLPPAPTQQPSVNRGLTPDEIEIARSVFGDALDTSQIRLTDDSPDPPNAVTFPNNIKFPRGDVNGPPSLTHRAWLVHELTHVWQYQRGRTVPQLALDAFRGDYDYGGEQGLRDAVAQGKRFGDFNHEEQGDILRDYYRKRELRQDISAYQPFVDQVRFGTSDGVFPEPYSPPGPVV